MPEDPLDIIIRLIGLRSFVAGADEAAKSMTRVGAASKRASEESSMASRRMAGAIGLITKAASAAAVAVVATGYEATKMAIKFDQQMEMIHTQAGASQAEVAAQSKNVLNLAGSGNFAQGPQQLAEGLFHLESIGLRGAKALNSLKIAAQGAAVGNADLEATATALGSAWLVNIKGGGNLNNVMGVLNATVGVGNVKMGDLVTALGTGLLPAAKVAGISLQNVMGAMAVLTDEGYQASSAAAQLATSLHFLYAPGTKASGALASVHLGSDKLANDLHGPGGLLTALRDLRDHINKFGGGVSSAKGEQVLNAILPAGRGRVLLTLMNQIDRYGMKIHGISVGTKNLADDIAKTHQTAAFKIHAAWSQIQANMIRVGHLLEPVAVIGAQAVSKFSALVVKAIPPIISAVQSIIGPVSRVIKNIIGLFSGGSGTGTSAGWVGTLHTTITAIGHFATTVGQTMTKIWNAVRPALSSIVGAFRTAFNSDVAHSISVIIGDLFKFLGAVARVAGFVISSAIPGIVRIVKGGFNIVAGVIKFIGDLLQLKIGKAFGDAAQAVVGAVNTIVGIVQTVFGPPIAVAIKLVNTLAAAFAGALSTAIDSVSGVITGVFQGAVSLAVQVLNWLIQKLNWFITAWNNTVGAIPLIGSAVQVGTISPITPPTFGTAAPTSTSPGPLGPSGLQGTPGATPNTQNPNPGVVTHNIARRDGRFLPTSPVPVAVASNVKFQLEIPLKVNGKEIARASGKFTGKQLSR